MQLHNLALSLMAASPVLSKEMRCGNVDDFLPQHEASQLSMRIRQTFPAPAPVNLTIHIIAGSESRQDGYLLAEEVDEQVQVIKDLFKPIGITFNHTNAHNRWVVNPLWAGHRVTPSTIFDDMKSALHVGDYRTLNLYFRNITVADYGGVCTNPVSEAQKQPDLQKRLLLDGCVINRITVPGSGHPFMSQGKTAVHEMGHWFGLFHPFHDNDLRENDTNPDPCSPTNPDDHVLDTPKMAYTEGMVGTCNLELNSCPNAEGNDPVRNYMSWSSDECMNEFTRGQTARIYEIWAKYRMNAIIVA